MAISISLEQTYVDGEAIRTCYRHLDQETGLSCTQCGRHICVRCMVPAAVGQVCRECAHARRPVNYQISLGSLAIAAPAAGLMSFALCLVALAVMVPLPIFVFYLLLAAGAAAARLVVRVLDWLTRAKRGKTFQIAVGVSLGVGALPIACAALIFASPVAMLLVGLFASVLIVTTMASLR